MFEPYYKFFQNEQVLSVVKILYQTSYVWVPALLLALVTDLWVNYRRSLAFEKLSHILLEVKIPKDIFKNPKAMEFFLNGLHQTGGEGTWYDKWWKGGTRAWFSLELVSIGGDLHFFVWTRKGFKNVIEANLYSQFPGIEIYEVPDYVLPVAFDPETTGMFASEFELTKADVFPIKTYIDYGLDKDPKEEYKIDPLTPLIEFFGSLPKDNQAWLQIVVRAHAAEDKDPVTGKMIDKKWAKAADEEIKKIYDKSKPEKDEEGKEKKPGRAQTKGEADVVAALERSISKRGFDVGMRAIYIAPKEVWSPDNIGGIIGGVTHFNSNDLNGFKPSVAGGKYGKPRYNFWPWKTWKDKNVNAEKQSMLDSYKARGFFYAPYRSKIFVLNTEELATIFHFPGGVSTTPTLSRIGSKKSEAPTNLPV